MAETRTRRKLDMPRGLVFARSNRESITIRRRRPPRCKDELTRIGIADISAAALTLDRPMSFRHSTRALVALLGFVPSLSVGQAAIDPAIQSYINSIRAIDDHA